MAGGLIKRGMKKENVLRTTIQKKKEEGREGQA